MDIFGSALLDYHNGLRDEPFLIHRDDGLVDHHDLDVYFDEEPLPHEAQALEYIIGPVLDVGCGAGRHLLWCERNNIEATGIDVSKKAIETCRLRGCKRALQFDVMSNADPGQLQRHNTVIGFGSNVGIGGTFAGSLELFRSLRRLVASNGRLIVTGIDIAKTENPIHHAYHERNRAAGRRRGEIRMRFEYRGHIGPWLSWYHPEPSELEEIATLSGWDVVELNRLDTGFFWAVLANAKGNAP